jgi:polysaccharide deacetylase family protein (PEP-CTERM system associated)
MAAATSAPPAPSSASLVRRSTPAAGNSGAAPSRIVNAMTIDVEDYFHASALAPAAPMTRWDSLESRVVRNTDRLLELFADANVASTFFILGWVAERQPSLVRRIHAAGHEIASHGYFHQLAYDLEVAQFRQDVRKSKQLLEDLTGTRVDGYRAPSYSITRRSLWALDVLLDEGYTYDASIFPIRHDRYGIPDAPRHPYQLARQDGRQLIEAPPSTVRLGGANLPIAGGGYFRLLPYGWTRWGIGRVNRVEQRPVIFYLHPWEIDPGQPRLPVGRVSRLRHYRNLDRAEPRLQRLLRDFAFAPLDRVLRDAQPIDRSWTPEAISA